jgi:two-component system, NtrC family, response regulator HydG
VTPDRRLRQLEQAVRRILLTGLYEAVDDEAEADLCRQLQDGIARGSLDADELLSGYCRLLHQRHGTYEEVARRTRLDRRTAKAYILRSSSATNRR